MVGCADPEPVPGVPIWHDGEAFAIEVDLPHPGHVVVVHVDARGVATLVHPEHVDAPAPRMDAGRVRIPPEDAAYSWVFEGEPGWETFIVGRSDRRPDLIRLVRALDAPASVDERDVPDPRAARVRAALDIVREQLGHADRIEVLHLP
jgi:hypothetical protein